MSPVFPLLIGDLEQAAIAELLRRAAASPTDYATMQRLAAAPADDAEAIRAMNRALTIDVPVGYSVTLTHEEHKPNVMCRHASIALKTRPGRGPSEWAVRELLTLLGFHNTIGKMPMYLETLQDGTVAPNFIEPLDGDVAKLAR